MTAPILDLENFRAVPGKKLVQPAYRVGLTLYPHKNDPVFVIERARSRRMNWERDSEGTVVGMSWSKRLGQPSGQWSTQVKLGRNASIDPLSGDVLDGDWADLVMVRNGIEFQLARGIVDAVREQRSTLGGATVRTLTITGRDHGAMTETIIAWNNIFAQNLSELVQGYMTQRVESRVGGSPDEMFRVLVNATFAQGTSATQSAWTLPPSLRKVTGAKRYGEAVTIRTDPLKGALFNELNLWTKPGQTLHQTLQQWCNPLLNEWVFDTERRPGKDAMDMVAYIRERPYVTTERGLNGPWFHLPTWRVPSWLATDSDLGRSGHERFTIIELVADWQFGTQQEQTGLAPPIWSRTDVEHYGIKPYLESTIFVAESAATGAWVNDRLEWQRQLADWFAPNPYWLSGTITFGCSLPELKVGHRLIIDTGNPTTTLQGYIEGVSHTYQWAPDGATGPRTSTTITLTRGWRGSDEDLVKMVKAVSNRFQESVF